MLIKIISKLERGIRKSIEERVMNNCQRDEPSHLRMLSFYMRIRWKLFCWAINQGLWVPDALNILLASIKREDNFLDIGANVGWISSTAGFILSGKGKVYGFEPSPSVFKFLKNRMTSLKHDNVTIYNFALGREDSAGILHEFSENFGGASSLRSGAWEGHAEDAVSEVTIKHLDSFLEDEAIKNIALVKMDVQGAELDVLDGAHSLLNGEYPPILYVEVEACALKAFDHSREDLLSSIYQNGYEVYCWRYSGLERIESARDLSDSGHDDVICFKGKGHYKIKKFLQKLSSKAVVKWTPDFRQ